MPKPPPRLSSSRVCPVASRTGAEQPDDPVRGGLEAGGVEDLRADVAVQAGQVQPRLGRHPLGRLQRVAGGQREAELLVLVRGGDELVGVRLDADGRPDQHRDGRAPGRDAGGAERDEPVDLVEGVDDDVPDARVDSQPQLGRRLVVAVQGDPLGGEAGGKRQRELVAAAGVQVQAVVGDPAGHLAAEEGLRRVVHVGAGEGVGEVLGPAAEVVLVEHEQRGAVGAGQLGRRQPAQVQLAVDPLGRAGPDVRVQCAELLRRRAGGRRRGDVPVQRARPGAPSHPLRAQSRRARPGRCAAPPRSRRTATAAPSSAGSAPRRRAGGPGRRRRSGGRCRPAPPGTGRPGAAPAARRRR